MESEGGVEGGEDGWSVCMPNGGWQTAGQNGRKNGRSPESTERVTQPRAAPEGSAVRGRFSAV